MKIISSHAQRNDDDDDATKWYFSQKGFKSFKRLEISFEDIFNQISVLRITRRKIMRRY